MVVYLRPASKLIDSLRIIPLGGQGEDIPGLGEEEAVHDILPEILGHIPQRGESSVAGGGEEEGKKHQDGGEGKEPAHRNLTVPVENYHNNDSGQRGDEPGHKILPAGEPDDHHHAGAQHKGRKI